MPAGASLVVASSMPVRDVESFAAPRDGVTFYANRGVNGIDGFVSTALGVADRRPTGPTVALLGDLCFLHDSNGLLGAVDRGVDATFVVVDNGGGGIFSFLPQAELPEHFETLFGTPHRSTSPRWPRSTASRSPRSSAADELEPALLAAVDAGGVQVVLVRTDRDDERHPSPRGVGRGRGSAGLTPWRSSPSMQRRGLRDGRGRASMGSSLAWVSAHSASGSDPATMPAPATRRARAPSSSAPRSAIAHSPSPRASTQPDRTGVATAVERPRARGWRRARAGAGRAADRRRRVQQPGQLERARRRVREPAADRRGEVRDGSEHRDVGDRVGVRARSQRGPSTSTIAVDDEAVLAACPSPTPRARAARRRCRRRWCRRPAATRRRRSTAPHEELGARADEALGSRTRTQPGC